MKTLWLQPWTMKLYIKNWVFNVSKSMKLEGFYIGQNLWNFIETILKTTWTFITKTLHWKLQLKNYDAIFKATITVWTFRTTAFVSTFLLLQIQQIPKQPYLSKSFDWYIVALGCFQTSHLNFCFGLSVGLVISFLIASFSSLQTPLLMTRKYAAHQFDSYLSSRSLQEVGGTYDEMHDDLDKRLSNSDVKEVRFDDEHQHHGKLFHTFNFFLHFFQFDNFKVNLYILWNLFT